MFTKQYSMTLGRVRVSLDIAERDPGGFAAADSQLELLARLLNGIALGEDVVLFARLLNGPTVDRRLGRNPAKPCGCKGKS